MCLQRVPSSQVCSPTHSIIRLLGFTNIGRRQEKSTQAVLDRLDQQQAFFDRLDTKLDHNDSELMKIMKKVRDQTNDQHDKFMRILTELGLNVEKIASGPSKVKTKGKGRPTQAQGDNRPMKSEEGGMAPENSPDPAASYSEEEKTVDDCHSIPVEHSTAAHKLLAWRWIKYLVDRDGHDEDYVMKLEENRGLIRVYGWGEGHDASEGPGPDPFYSEDGGYPHSASPRTPSAPPDYSTCEMLPGSGFLITDPATVRRFRTSYLEHMHKLHPFLDFRELDKKISAFTQAYCPQRSSASPITIGSNAGDLPRGAKRKRSDTQHSHGPRRVERTVENAIILLVLAVGSICEFRNEPLPSLSYPQWATDSSLATSQTPGHTFSPVDGQASFTSMTSVRSGPEPRRQRNMDVMPGLAYYAYATDILGNLQGSTRLPYAQAALLAGIYVGQLAHPFQSHAWITQAARTCQVLLRPKHYEKLQDGPVKDLYLFLFWTCFQLESDLLAELDLPDSGISRMDPQIGLPTGQFTMDVPDQPGEIFGANYMTMILYSAQITLRKILNRTHTDLYRVAKKQKHKLPAEKKDVHSILSLTLEQWRACLPNELRWKDDDPPAEDINVARLRAKYYGARYIIHRPVLYHYLEMFPPPGKQDPWSSPADSQSNRKTFSVGANETPFSQMPLDNQKACKTCVESAISSTKAFDGVKGGRPVVTNIFGTAHA